VKRSKRQQSSRDGDDAIQEEESFSSCSSTNGNADTTSTTTIDNKAKVMKEYTQSLQEENAKMAKDFTTLKAKIQKLEKKAVLSSKVREKAPATIPNPPLLFTHSDAVSLLMDVGGRTLSLHPLSTRMAYSPSQYRHATLWL
jgi:hypothetical protein